MTLKAALLTCLLTVIATPSTSTQEVKCLLRNRFIASVECRVSSTCERRAVELCVRSVHKNSLSRSGQSTVVLASIVHGDLKLLMWHSLFFICIGIDVHSKADIPKQLTMGVDSSNTMIAAIQRHPQSDIEELQREVEMLKEKCKY